MKKRKGISLVIVTTAVAIMMILISVASVVGSGAISSANFDEYRSNISRVSDLVNEYYLQNDSLPVTNDVVNLYSLPNDFRAELNDNNDLSNTLFVINVDLLNDETIKNGRGTLSSQDVFLVAEETNNVYYMKGFKYKSKTYYGV